MSVKKIFMTLIVVVACVIVGALVLNVLLPNAATQLVDQVETQLKNATGLEFDFNGNNDGNAGGQGNGVIASQDTTGAEGKSVAGGVNGFK